MREKFSYEIFGQNLIYPDAKPFITKDSFEINAFPNDKEVIIFKTHYNQGLNASIVHNTSHGLMWNISTEEMKKMVEEKGEKKTYSQTSLVCSSLILGDWYSLLYENIGNSTLDIEIRATVCVNLHCTSDFMAENNEIKFVLNAQQNKFIAFRKKELLQAWEFQSSLSIREL